MIRGIGILRKWCAYIGTMNRELVATNSLRYKAYSINNTCIYNIMLFLVNEEKKRSLVGRPNAGVVI